MGCDIHMVLERREKGGTEWVGVWCSDDMPGGRPKIAQRDYAFFGEVANVRCKGGELSRYPQNIPKDVSRLAWLSYMDSPTDHHSASHLSVDDFTAAWFRAQEKQPAIRDDRGPRKEHAAYDLLGIHYDEQYDFRVVFWFDN